MFLEQPYPTWLRKYGTLVQQNNGIRKNDEIKKSLPKTLAKEIELKKKQHIKENGSIEVLEYLNKHSTKD
tara:strand:- start:49 stop:258 length:210 start_codon:yes stop_codon:yes gene_type:complete